MFDTSVVYEANYNSTADIVINQGGTDSTKTFSIMQVLVTIACCTQAPPIDAIITILAESVPNLKKGAWRIAQTIMNGNSLIESCVKSINYTDRIISFKSGWVMEFASAIDEQNAKQGKRQYLFANEANGIPWLIFWQMAKRTRIRTWVDYNPSAEFWPHEKLIGTLPSGNDLNAKVELIISDHRHNPFLTQQDHDKTENIKDPDLWRVYARGLTGKTLQTIYNGWIQVENFPFDEPKRFAGIDFGYTNDPTVIVDCRRLGNSIYVRELCFEPGISAFKMATMLKDAGYTGDDPVYCDHDNDIIMELRRFDIMAMQARKKIQSGIDKVKEFNIYVYNSKNIWSEHNKYCWMKDKATGKILSTPIDEFNHSMDAIRYAIATNYYKTLD